jgi:hypothetical protein
MHYYFLISLAIKKLSKEKRGGQGFYLCATQATMIAVNHGGEGS